MCLFNQKVGKVGVMMSLELEKKVIQRFVKISESRIRPLIARIIGWGIRFKLQMLCPQEDK